MHRGVIGFAPGWLAAGQAVLLGLVYFGAAKLSLALAVPPGYATPVWPPSGIALAVLLVAGSRLWPGVWLGSLAANLTIEGSIAVAALIATGSTLQSVAAAQLVRRHAGVPYRFTRVSQVLKFVGATALASTVAPTLGVLPIAITHGLDAQEFLSNWWTWWQGDWCGMIIVAPLILSWAALDPIAWSTRRVAEGLAYAALVVATSYVVFGGTFADASAYSVTFLVVPLVVWGAFRFGQRGVATATAAICGIAIWNTLQQGRGPFAWLPVQEALLLLLAFTATLAITGLILGAVLRQLDEAMAQLRGRQTELEERVSIRTRELEEANRRLQQDVAARARTEQLLVESERRFRLMVDSVVDYAIVRLDVEGRVASWNSGAQRITGYAAEEIIGENFARFYSPEDVERGKPAEELALARSQGRYEVDGWRIRKDGSRYWAGAVITAVRGERGELLGFSKVTRDLTERNRVEAALVAAKVAAEKANEAKSQFLANMSHELRTPLNSLLILARLLSDNPTGNLSAKQIQFARTIYDSGMDLLTLINDLLDLAKIESGALTSVNMAPASLDEIKDELERAFAEVAQQKGLRFEIAVDAALPRRFRTDAARVKQVLKNLLSNAFKFTRTGSVSLRIGRPAPGWAPANRSLAGQKVIVFHVSDTGIGIPSDKQAIIFEAFQQADGTTSRQYGGTGLGLSISRELTRLLGGEIRLASDPGIGSTFSLYLPLGEESAPA